MLRYLFLFIFFSISVTSIKAQIKIIDATTPPYTPESLIKNYFLGNGIEVIDIKYEGAKESVGYFYGAKNVGGIERGIVLSNGLVKTPSSGTPSVESISGSTATFDTKVNPKDKDIDLILKDNGTTLNSTNLVKYTITFIPSSDTLRFRYVFASEEYPKYICGQGKDDYNDLFGFFISGPGISGPYENNGQNIALIPGTNLPVTIKNINPGNPNKAMCPPKFAQYYNDNEALNVPPVYNGILDAFVAQAVVKPCETYTIKIVLADVGDGFQDSGVFLEAKSFGTPTVEVDTYTESLDNTMIEGCGKGAITFRLPNKIDKDFPINCKVIGTATNGTDYKRIPTNLFISKGDSALVINIETLNDNITEGVETIGFDIIRDICNRDTFWFNIKDNTFSKVTRNTISDTTICKNSAVVLDATVFNNQKPPTTFINNDSTKINTVRPNTADIPTILPLNVTNIFPKQFTLDMLESVCINARHPWIDDLDVYLIAPNGQFIALSTDNGGSGGNNTGMDYYTNTCFSPKATTSITTGSSPFTGTWLPQDNFQELISSNGNNPANGTWQLMIIDDQAGLDGTILNWSISFKSNYNIYYDWNTTQNISCSKCPAPVVNPNKDFSYQVTITDSYGCALKDTSFVRIQDSLAAPNIVCGIQTHSSVNFTWLPIKGASGYQINVSGTGWIDIGKVTSYNVTNLMPDSPIAVSIKSVGGNCFVKTNSIICRTLPCPTVLPTMAQVQQVTCKGANNGKATINVASGGTPPYTYKMSSQQNTTGTFDNLAPGKYTVSISDAFTCPASVVFEIIEPDELTATIQSDNASCVGSKDAEAIVEASGGTKPYSYLWSNNVGNSKNTNLGKGTYTVTVTDANSCSIIKQTIVGEPLALELKSFVTPNLCFGKDDGTAIAIVSGGNPPYDYLWNTNLGLQPNRKVINLSPGIHTITITDVTGCTIRSAIVITDATALNIAKNIKDVSCFGSKDGNIELSLTGGKSPYKYLWSQGDTISKLNNLAGGLYYTTITDANNCSYLDTVTIKVPDSIFFKINTIKNNNCFGESKGIIDVQAQGGNGNFDYNWSNKAITATINNLSAGTYIVTATDAKKCFLIDTFDIKTPDSIVLNAIVKNTDCSGNSGSITLNPNGGIAPYQYSWASDKGFSATTADITNIEPANYSVTVTDAAGCTKVATYEITLPVGILLSEKITNISCFDQNNGKIEVTPKNGTAPYTYVWSNGKTTNINDLLTVGKYTVTVTDATACTGQYEYTVSQPDLLELASISKKDTICNGTATGSIEVQAKGGISPYTFKWTNSSTSNKIDNLAKGNYSVIITDKNNCTHFHAFEIVETPKITPTLTEAKAPLCHNSQDAIIQVSNIDYGSATGAPLTQFSYIWSDNITNNATLNNAKAGNTYTITITDNKGCTVAQSITVSNPSQLSISTLGQVNPSCTVGNDGNINIQVNGGTPPYSYLWSNNATTAAISGLADGKYSITVTDNNNCIATQDFTLTKPQGIDVIVSKQNELCRNTSTGWIKLETTQGKAPFSYSWSNGANTNEIKNLPVGTYSYTITDANGCILKDEVTIDSVSALKATLIATPVACRQTPKGSLEIIASGGTFPYTYSIDGKAFGPNNKFIGLESNIYDIQIKDANGCLLTDAVTIEQALPPTINLGNDTTIVLGETYAIPVTLKNATGNIILNWTPNDTAFISCANCNNPIVKPKINTLFTLTVKDISGCEAQASVWVRLKASNNVILVPTGFSPNEDNQNDILLVHGDKDAFILDFKIFDRWGELLYQAANFKTNDSTIGWDGKHRDDLMPSGTYPWIMTVKFKDNSIQNLKGTTTLIR